MQLDDLNKRRPTQVELEKQETYDLEEREARRQIEEEIREKKAQERLSRRLRERRGRVK